MFISLPSETTKSWNSTKQGLKNGKEGEKVKK